MTAPLIIIADDNSGDIDLLGEALHAIGGADLRVISAVDGQQAWRLLSDVAPGERLPNLMIVDLNLPYISGSELAKRMKQHERFRDIPIVVISSGSIPDLPDGQAAACFEKPGEWSDYLGLARKLTESFLRIREPVTGNGSAA